jgi:hypothetical protein
MGFILCHNFFQMFYVTTNMYQVLLKKHAEMQVGLKVTNKTYNLNVLFIFVKFSSTKFHENLFICSWVVTGVLTDRQTDMQTCSNRTVKDEVNVPLLHSKNVCFQQILCWNTYGEQASSVTCPLSSVRNNCIASCVLP